MYINGYIRIVAEIQPLNTGTKLNLRDRVLGEVGFPSGSDSKESACNAGELSSIPGSGRCPGEGNGYPLQYSCLENSMDRRAWWAIVHELAKSWIQLSD